MVLVDVLLLANRQDPTLEKERSRAYDVEDANWTTLDDLVLYKGRLVVPDTDNLRTRVIEEAHARLTTAHPGRGKTRRLVAQRYWWAGLHKDIDRYVANCPCRAAKVPHDKTPGKLTPLPVPEHVWQHVVMDFKSFPKDDDGNNMTLGIMDRLSKITWTTACKDTVTAKDAAEMYYRGPFRVFGWPESFTSDRGPQFISDFTDELSKIDGTKLNFSSAGHHETVGLIENMHQWMDQCLRPFIEHHQRDWSRGLPALDAIQVSLPYDSLGGLTPHEVLSGRPMRMPFD